MTKLGLGEVVEDSTADRAILTNDDKKSFMEYDLHVPGPKSYVSTDVYAREVTWPTQGKSIAVRGENGTEVRGRIEQVGQMQTDGEDIDHVFDLGIDPDEIIGPGDLPNDCSRHDSGMILCSVDGDQLSR
jgi:hypothetical protein